MYLIGVKFLGRLEKRYLGGKYTLLQFKKREVYEETQEKFQIKKVRISRHPRTKDLSPKFDYFANVNNDQNPS